jgi:hypothetical protein
MTPATEKPLSVEPYFKKTDAADKPHLGISSPRQVWYGSKFRPREDELVFKRWRLRFFIFYGAVALLISGLAVVDRPRAFISAGVSANPAIASANDIRRPH